MISDLQVEQLKQRRERADALRKEAKAAEDQLASSRHEGMEQYISMLREAADRLIEANQEDLAKWLKPH